MSQSFPNLQQHLRLRDGAIATLFLLAACLAMIGISRTDPVYYSPRLGIYTQTAGLFALTIPGPIVRLWDLPAQILLWNAVGWTAGVTFLGLASVGALPLAPLILTAFALTFWPREPGSTAPPAAIAIAVLGGFLVCWLMWGQLDFALPTLDDLNG